MMTRNSYALNMGFVMEQAPVKPQRAILEANMGGDKKPSHRYFERGGHGKTVIAEVTLTEAAVRRNLRTTTEDLLDALLRRDARRGRLRDAVRRLHARDVVAALFTATGQDIGMVGTSSMAHGTGSASRAA